MRCSRKQLIENQKRLRERDRLYRRHGYDSGKAARFVLKQAGRFSGRVLEIGTGKGRFLVALARRASRITTIDPDAVEQHFARLNAAYAGVARRIRFVVADGAALPFAKGSFDLIVSMNALHHIRNLNGVLDEILRVIKPDGRIVLSDFDESGFRIFDRIHAAEGRTHERVRYSWRSLVARLRRRKLSVRPFRGFGQQGVVAGG